MCALEQFLGFDCPGCGLTRSLITLLSGDFLGSVTWHPMGVLVFLWAINLWWFRKFSFSNLGRKIVSHGVLAGFFVPWIVQFFI